MPIHRLDERPTQHAVIGDITCDSDGKIDQFIDRRDVKKTLPLHAFNGEPYYLGVFLVGAYQEILGDLHNLFGDTHAVHVSLDGSDNIVVDEVVKGDTVREVLDYVEFDVERLVNKFRADIEAAVREGRVNDGEMGAMLRFYEEGLQRLHLPGRAAALAPSALRRQSTRRPTAKTPNGRRSGRISGPRRRPSTLLVPGP